MKSVKISCSKEQAENSVREWFDEIVDEGFSELFKKRVYNCFSFFL